MICKDCKKQHHKKCLERTKNMLYTDCDCLHRGPEGPPDAEPEEGAADQPHEGVVLVSGSGVHSGNPNPDSPNVLQKAKQEEF